MSSRHEVYVVTAPVEHLRATPGTSPQPGTHDPDQETQLLYGERVRLINTQDAWAYVEAVEQPEYTHTNRWQGYPGWLPLFSLQPLQRHRAPNAVITSKWATIWSDPQATRPWFQLPMGARVTVIPGDEPLWSVQLVSGASGWIAHSDVGFLKELRHLPPEIRRRAILYAAYALLGDPYFWGGRAPASASASRQAIGVDCSGLVNLSYRTAGLEIPRDAHEQYLRAKRITRLQPADLIFLSDPLDLKKITHVMLYAGDGWVIEGPGTGLSVRRIEVARRLGLPIDQVRPGVQVDRRTVYLGAYLP